MSEGEDSEGVAASKGVDVDPTKNVLDLVNAESKFQDAMRLAEAKRQDGLREANDRRQNDLAAMRDKYEAKITTIVENCEHRIADILTKSADNVQTMRTGQIGDLAKKVSALEEARYEERGKTSVTDPALAAILERMTRTLSSLEVAGGSAGGAAQARNQFIGWAVALLIAGISLAYNLK